MNEEYIPRSVVVDLLTEKQRAICPTGRLGREYVYGRDRDEYDAIEADIDAVQNVPAADVRPVVRGRFEKKSEGINFGDGICSNCKSRATWSVGHEYAFCPFCGTMMEATP